MRIKSIAIILFCTSQLFGQYGLNKYPETYPDPDLTQEGYPALEYFQRFGPKYIQIYSFYEEGDSNKVSYYKSYYKLRGNKIKVRTRSSDFLFPKISKFKVIDNEIRFCNRFGKEYPRNINSYKTVNKIEVNKNDSTFYQWVYQISGNDTTIWNSHRNIYNIKRELIKAESSWNIFADNDSTWHFAESSKLGWGVERVVFSYLEKNTIKIVWSRLSSENNRTRNTLMTLKYDDNGHLIERIDKNLDNSIITYFRFIYEKDLCISYEISDSEGNYQRATVLRD